MKKLVLLIVLLTAFQATAQTTALTHQPRVLIVSPEQTGVLQTGGLAHATADLAKTLIKLGVETEVLMPGYLAKTSTGGVETGEKISVVIGGNQGEMPTQAAFKVSRESVRGNPTIYLNHVVTTQSKNYFDNNGIKAYSPEFFMGEAVGAYAQAAAKYIAEQNYDLVVLNDWTSGLIALHLKDMAAKGVKIPKILFAIHNVAYQGVFPKALGDFLRINRSHDALNGYEFHGQMSFLKTGLMYSDMTYTVSPTYAREIESARSGAGLDGVIRMLHSQHRMTGILNGIVNADWDPSVQREGLSHTFTTSDLSGKAVGRAEIQAEFGLPVDATKPVFALTSRLAEQKGFNYLILALDRIAKEGRSQVVIVGDGDASYVENVKALAAKYPDAVRYAPFSNALEKKLMRHADFFVNAAWFEPSGLNQFFALRNGTLPVVSQVGGLKDSVKDGVNGITFEIVPGANGANYDYTKTQDNIVEAFGRAVTLFHNASELKAMRVRAMTEDHSWEKRIKESYLPLFKYVLTEGYKTREFNPMRSERELRAEKPVEAKAPALKPDAKKPSALKPLGLTKHMSCPAVFMN